MENNKQLYLDCYSRLGFNKANNSLDTINIYLSYNKDDFNHIEKVKDKILKKINANIYFIDYNKYQEFDKEDLYVLLKEMDFAVFIITNDYLDNVENSYQNEYSYFYNSPIKMVPIMMEHGLADKYQEKFEDIQYMNFEEEDLSKISFESKLDTFIYKEDIKTNSTKEDALAASKDFFKKKIFISYRKVDRKYAQKVVESIHSIEANQNIAIWYDDFLVPGESFNNDILDKINDADIFLLLVTPNVLIGDNYVKTIEYIKAKEYKKTIIPVLVEPTDEKELKKQFIGIPSLIKLNDVSDKIEEFYRGKWDIDTLNDEELFVLGLNYLKGLQVERNNELALKYIVKASETNTNALYQYSKLLLGDYGYKKDYYKFKEVSERLIDILEDQLNFNQFDEVCDKYIDVYESYITICDKVDYSANPERENFVSTLSRYDSLKETNIVDYYKIQATILNTCSDYYFYHYYSREVDNGTNRLLSLAKEVYEFDNSYSIIYLQILEKVIVDTQSIILNDVCLSDEFFKVALENIKRSPQTFASKTLYLLANIISIIDSNQRGELITQVESIVDEMKNYVPSFNDLSDFIWVIKVITLTKSISSSLHSEKYNILAKYKLINLLKFNDDEKFIYYRALLVALLRLNEPEKAFELAKEGFNTFLKSTPDYSYLIISIVMAQIRTFIPKEEVEYYENWMHEYDLNSAETQDEASFAYYVSEEEKMKVFLAKNDFESAQKLIHKSLEFHKKLFKDSKLITYKKPLSSWLNLLLSAKIYCEKVNDVSELRNAFYYMENFINIKDDSDNYLFCLANLVAYARQAASIKSDLFKAFFIEITTFTFNKIYSISSSLNSKETAQCCFGLLNEGIITFDFNIEEKIKAFYTCSHLITILGDLFHSNPDTELYVKNVFTLANHFYKLGADGKKEVSKILKEFIDVYHLVSLDRSNKETLNADRELYYLMAIAFLIEQDSDARAYKLFYEDFLSKTKGSPIPSLIRDATFFMEGVDGVNDFRNALYTCLFHIDLLSLSSSESPFKDIVFITDDYLKQGNFEDAKNFHIMAIEVLTLNGIKPWINAHQSDVPLLYDLLAKYYLYDSVINNFRDEIYQNVLDFYEKHKINWDLLTSEDYYKSKIYDLNNFVSRGLYEKELSKTQKGIEIWNLVAKDEFKKWKKIILNPQGNINELGFKRILQGYFDSIFIYKDQLELFIQKLINYVEILQTLIVLLENNERFRQAALVYYGIYAPLVVNQYAYIEKYNEALEYGNYVLSYVKENNITINEMLYTNMAVSCMKLNRPKDETAFYLKEAVMHHSYYSKEEVGKIRESKRDLIKILNTLIVYDPENKDYYWNKVSVLIESNNPDDVTEKITAYNYLIRFEALHSNYSEALSLATEKLAFLNQKYNPDDKKEEFIKTYQQLSDVYKQLGDEDKSYEYYLLAQKLINNE